MKTKQIIVMRKDLKMRRGKEIAQSCHASMAFLTRRLENEFIPFTLNRVEKDWLNGSFAKVCLQINSEQELMDLEKAANDAGLECHLIIDSGRTEFDGVPTPTCLAIGPDFVDRIDKITGHLKLY